MFAALISGFVYFLAAALVFPRNQLRWTSLDEHYWVRKRWVLGGIIIVNLAATVAQFTRALPRLDDFWFFYWILGYYLPLTGLLLSKRRRVDLALLTWLIVYFLLAATDVLPPSQWGDAVGLNGSPASTSADPSPK